jgi:hypothetical protein
MQQPKRGGIVSSADRTPDEIAADIAVTRNRLAGTVDQLIYRSHPKTIARRQAAITKAKFVDETGSPKLDAILKVVGVAAGLVVAIVVLRKIVG